MHQLISYASTEFSSSLLNGTGKSLWHTDLLNWFLRLAQKIFCLYGRLSLEVQNDSKHCFSAILPLLKLKDQNTVSLTGKLNRLDADRRLSLYLLLWGLSKDFKLLDWISKYVANSRLCYVIFGAISHRSPYPKYSHPIY